MNSLIYLVLILIFIFALYYQRKRYKQKENIIINDIQKRAHNFQELFCIKTSGYEITNMTPEKLKEVKQKLENGEKKIDKEKINQYGNLVILEKQDSINRIDELENELLVLRKENKFNKDIEYYYSKEFVSKLTYLLEEVNGFADDLGENFNRKKVVLMIENIKNKIKFLIENFIESGSIELREYKLNGIDELRVRLGKVFEDRCELNIQIDIVNTYIYIEVDKIFIILQTLISSIIKMTAAKISLNLSIEVGNENLIFRLEYFKTGIPFYDIFDEDFLETKRIKSRSWNFDINKNDFSLITPIHYGEKDDAELLKKMIISSNMHHIDYVENNIILDAKDKRLSKEYLKELKLILDELLINAIEHGNKFDINKSVYINYYFGLENELNVEIEDEGDGFDISELKEPDFLSERGRGVFMCKKMTDQLEYSQQGRKVNFTKKDKQGKDE